jgi:hypothetical protein
MSIKELGRKNPMALTGKNHYKNFHYEKGFSGV